MREYELLIPEFIIAFAALAVLAVELSFPRIRKDFIAYFTAAWGVAVIVVSAFYVGNDADTFQGVIQVDDFTTTFRIIGGATLVFTCIASAQFVRERVRHVGEYYALLLLSLIGFNYLAGARELLTAYISLELFSFSLYILVSYLKRDANSNEGGLKYLFLGAFSSAFFLYGLSIIYGLTGTTTYDGIAEALSDPASDTHAAVIVGMILVLVGVGFKVSAVPFHNWAPDAYQGAPIPITAYLSAASKAGGFALFLRLFSGAFMPIFDDWQWIVAALAATTMIVGNLVAIQQTNMRRLFAYSSIGQVGYMMMGIAALQGSAPGDGQDAAAALLLHLVGYAITNMAAFTILVAFYNKTGKDDIADMRGLAETQPFLALTMAAALFSLAGMPLFAGFATKFFLFQSAVSSGLLWLAILAIVNSMISLYYYLVVIKQMYLGRPWLEGRLKVSPLLSGSIFVLTAGVLFVGIYPGPVFEALDNAAEYLFVPGADQAVRTAQTLLFWR